MSERYTQLFLTLNMAERNNRDIIMRNSTSIKFEKKIAGSQIRDDRGQRDGLTYTFFFWPFFLKFLGFFPAVIFSTVFIDSSKGFPY